MAQGYYCDNTDQHAGADEPERAAIVYTELDSGTVLAFCMPCWVGYVGALAAALADQGAAEPSPAAPPDAEAGEDDDDADAIARLTPQGGPGDSEPAAATEQAGGATHPRSVPPDAPQDGPRVVRRGTSASRRAHQARRRARERATTTADDEADPAAAGD